MSKITNELFDYLTEQRPTASIEAEGSKFDFLVFESLEEWILIYHHDCPTEVLTDSDADFWEVKDKYFSEYAY